MTARHAVTIAPPAQPTADNLPHADTEDRTKPCFATRRQSRSVGGETSTTSGPRGIQLRSSSPPISLRNSDVAVQPVRGDSAGADHGKNSTPALSVALRLAVLAAGRRSICLTPVPDVPMWLSPARPARVLGVVITSAPVHAYWFTSGTLRRRRVALRNRRPRDERLRVLHADLRDRSGFDRSCPDTALWRPVPRSSGRCVG